MKRPARPEARIALCYVRKSLVRANHATDQVSPNRQRDLIEALCAARGWATEWYVDAQGHRSGTTEQREQWQALKTRLHDPDVAALVAYDLSRLHRKGHRIGALLDECSESGIAVVMAGPHQQIDFSTPAGQLIATIIGMMDQMYAEDVSQRATAAAAHRKAQGKSIGRPPFGTTRSDSGFLIPSTEGAWILPGGSVVAGTSGEPPLPGAIWRGYYDCARRILDLYASGSLGIERIAYQLDRDGWSFRNRRGQPVRIEGGDVRRVIANWPEYGGAVLPEKASRRRARLMTADDVPLNPERAVFPPDLLRAVAAVRQRRDRLQPPDHGQPVTSYPYPLAGVAVCAHCNRLADSSAAPTLRARLGGKDGGTGRAVYRHRSGLRCGAQARSVRAAVIEGQLASLLDALSVQPALLSQLSAVAQEESARALPASPGRPLAEEKAAAIATCRRRIAAAITLFADGRIEEAEYRRRIESNERQIDEWEARRTGPEQVAVDVNQTVAALQNLRRLWAIADDYDRQALVRALFEELSVDLDAQEITGFRLKTWAHSYLRARASFLTPAVQGAGTDMLHTSFENASVPALAEAEARILQLARAHHLPTAPVSPDFTRRNATIRAAYAAGLSLSELAQLYGISGQRVHQIVNGRNH